ncbi:aquaporin [Streptomyces sp. NPDC001156]
MGAFPGCGLVPYVLAQMAGGSWAPGVRPAVSLRSIGYAAIVPAPSWQPASVFVAKAGSMTVIVLAVSFCMAQARYARLVPYVIGLSVALVIAFLRARSGGSINAARQFGPAPFAGQQTTDLRICLVAPILGAALGACLHHVLSRCRLTGEVRVRASGASPDGGVADVGVSRWSVGRPPVPTGVPPEQV